MAQIIRTSEGRKHISKVIGALLVTILTALTVLLVTPCTASAGVPSRRRCSTDALNVQGNGRSFSNSVSSDGRYVVFESVSNNLVAGDMNGRRDIFRKDLETRASIRPVSRVTVTARTPR